MSHLEVLKNPNKELRVKSRELSVEEIQSEKIQVLIENIKETMVAENGIGLAAPQIGEHVRLIIVETGKGNTAFFNPRIIKKSERLVDSEEGCLSIPGVYGIVKRHKSIMLEALDRDGKTVKIKTGGLLSFVFQHEIDHLDGILFIDKAYTLKNVETGEIVQL